MPGALDGRVECDPHRPLLGQQYLVGRVDPPLELLVQHDRAVLGCRLVLDDDGAAEAGSVAAVVRVVFPEEDVVEELPRPPQAVVPPMVVRRVRGEHTLVAQRPQLVEVRVVRSQPAVARQRLLLGPSDLADAVFERHPGEPAHAAASSTATSEVGGCHSE